MAELAPHLTQLFIDNHVSRSTLVWCATDSSSTYTVTTPKRQSPKICRPISTTKDMNSISVYDPATKELVSDKIPLADARDVDLAVRAAQQAFSPSSPWRRMTAAQRQQLLFRFADILEANTEYLANLTRRTLGAPFSAFGKGEIDTAISCFRCELFRVV